jgi:hypothetical protein
MISLWDVILGALKWAWDRDRPPLKVRGGPRGIQVLNDPVNLPPVFIFQEEPIEAAPDVWRATADYMRWAKRHSGVQARRVRVEFSIRGQDSAPVSVGPVQVRVTRSDAPVMGYVYGPSAGGDEFGRHVSGDLDRLDPAGHAVTEQVVIYLDSDGLPRLRPWERVQVSRGETETIIVVAETELHYCEFEVLLPFRGEYQTSTLIVRDVGDVPFKVTADRGNPLVTAIYNPP